MAFEDALLSPEVVREILRAFLIETVREKRREDDFNQFRPSQNN